VPAQVFVDPTAAESGGIGGRRDSSSNLKNSLIQKASEERVDLVERRLPRVFAWAA
jgi:hypothetical protein